jgi:LysR family transcriptional regulator, regulator for genes of the gallate degradation pathway
MEFWAHNLRHLRALAEICRLGSISAAADAVSLTQPAVTQAIHKLEGQWGFLLFERHADGMMPTDAAQLILPRVTAALAHIASPRVTMVQVRALIAFADAGSYTSASAATGLAQPSLHRAINDLSVALKRPLAERRGRGVALTEAGQRTVRAFRLACAELRAGLGELDGLKGHETGRIAIGAMPLSRARILPATVTAFHRNHPHVAIAIVEGSWQELIEPLRDGTLDLLIGALRDPSPGADVEQNPLFDDQPVIIARSGHPLNRGFPPDMNALASYPWTVPAPGTPLRTQWDRMFADAKVPTPAVPIECGSVITIRQILLDSDFLTLLSRDQLAVELDAGLLTILCAAPGQISRTIGMTTRSAWRPTALQNAFLETLTAQAKG